MIVHNLTGTEHNALYQSLETANGSRQYDFLSSIVQIALQSGHTHLSSAVIKALNFHAIACLHTHAGEYRPCRVMVGSGPADPDAFQPPPPFQVGGLMEEFINYTNRNWESVDSVPLAAFVLWSINNIHPFINGNGRTARAACYFVLCLKVGALLPGNVILPELLKANRSEYVLALKATDESAVKGNLDLTPLVVLIERLVKEQLTSSPLP